MKAILLIDHGSKRAEANHMLACMANLVQRLVGDRAVVRYAHMEIAEPSIAQGFADCIAGGADEVIAFPYMLSPGRHSTSDIPRLVAAAAAASPTVSYRVTSAFGIDERLGELILARAGIAPGDRLAADAVDCCWDAAHAAGACGEACPGRADEQKGGTAARQTTGRAG
jgi:sirohydrochlorin ferrochelatase